MTEIADIMHCLGRLEGKQDAILANHAEHVKRLNDHATRIGKLEKRMAWYAGVAAVLAAAFSLAVRHLPFFK